MPYDRHALVSILYRRPVVEAATPPLFVMGDIRRLVGAARGMSKQALLIGGHQITPENQYKHEYASYQAQYGQTSYLKTHDDYLAYPTYNIRVFTNMLH